jgi:N-acyl-D-amino-acid deacylase
MPGFIDTHVHAAPLFDTTAPADGFAPLLAQGITTVILGGDGFASCCSGGASLTTDYFRGIDGPVPEELSRAGVAEYLKWLDGRGPINAGVLVPANTLRSRFAGSAGRPLNAEEVDEMVDALRSALDDGALGLGTGLEYPPGTASTFAELEALNRSLADAGAVHASHARGYGAVIQQGVSELVALGAATGARQHIAHLRAQAAAAGRLLAEAEALDVPLTFDSYPYQAGSTLLTLPIVPVEIAVRGTDVILDWARTSDEVTLLERAGAAVELYRLASHALEHDEFGQELGHVAARRGVGLAQLVRDLIVNSRGAVTVVVPADPRAESEEDYVQLLHAQGHMTCSDGIYLGDHPHPRGWGAFARVLSRHVRERGDLSIEDAAVHLSRRAADTFSVPDRGVLTVGSIADIAIVDLERVTDRATYSSPRVLADGVDRVIVAGNDVWRDGQVVSRTGGRALRRQGVVDA